MTLEDLIGLADAYMSLGGNATDQLRDVVEDTSTIADQKPNVLDYACGWLDQVATFAVGEMDDELASEARGLATEIREALATPL